MDNNKSKQIILSIIGVAVLVALVAGVSFAFFTYSRTGPANNVITTGKINFKYQDTNNVELTNQFPATTEKGKLNNAFTFQITGSLGLGSNPIVYTVYAIKGDDEDGKVRMKDEHIRVYAQKTSGTGTISDGYDGTDGAIAGNSASGFQIATGTLEAGGSIDDQYSVKMWVDKDVTISDTDTSADYCASDEECADPETRTVYSSAYYSLKIKVEAHDQV